MGFDAAWFAKAGICILLALVVGFLGSLYVGAKYLGSSHGPADRTTESKAPPPAAPGPVATRDPVPPAQTVQTAPDLESDRNNALHTPSAPQASQPGRDAAVAESREELRLGQQERRRLRAERRKNLENANARMQKPQPGSRRQDDQNEPFFPFRIR